VAPAACGLLWSSCISLFQIMVGFSKLLKKWLIVPPQDAFRTPKFWLFRRKTVLGQPF
jgi:hypothetical protein